MEEEADEEVHDESEPDDESGAPESVDFDDAVGDDVGYGEYDDTCGEGYGSDGNGFDFHEVGHDQADAEEECQDEECRGEGGGGVVWLSVHCSCFLRGRQALGDVFSVWGLFDEGLIDSGGLSGDVVPIVGGEVVVAVKNMLRDFFFE